MSSAERGTGARAHEPAFQVGLPLARLNRLALFQSEDVAAPPPAGHLAAKHFPQAVDVAGTIEGTHVGEVQEAAL